MVIVKLLSGSRPDLEVIPPPSDVDPARWESFMRKLEMAIRYRVVCDEMDARKRDA